MDHRLRERRRAVQRSAVRRRRRVAASLAALVLLVGLATAAATAPLFDVSEVRVRGVSGEQAAAVRSAASVATGDNLLRVDLGAVTERVEALAWVRSAEIHRAPPAALEIAVDRREPAAVVRLREAVWVVDAEGAVLRGGDAPELVEIIAPDAVLPDVGEQVSDAAVRNALAVHRGLPGPLRTAVRAYHAEGVRGLRLLLDPAWSGEEITVRFGIAERIDAKARVLGLLLAQARRQAAGEEAGALAEQAPAGIAEIDVRAPDNPVLVPVGEG